jgi:hypothetical protein
MRATAGLGAPRDLAPASSGEADAVEVEDDDDEDVVAEDDDDDDDDAESDDDDERLVGAVLDRLRPCFRCLPMSSKSEQN